MQLALPLPDQRLGGQHQDWLAAREGHQLRGHRELDGLAKPDLIGEHETGAMRAEMRLERKLHEMLLMRPEADLLAIDRGLDDGRGRLGLSLPVGEISDDTALGDALDVLDDGLRQLDGKGGMPEGVELFLHPVNGVVGIMLPEQLVVEPSGGQ